MRVLLLGGTTEATAMAQSLHRAGVDAVFSYAGRTLTPISQPIETRSGGFGGTGGLVTYLQDRAITHVIDATHPFAAQMSNHALIACARANVALCALERPGWKAGAGDSWRQVGDMQAAVLALPDGSARVFLAIGRQSLAQFAVKPQHFYLLRMIDPPTCGLPLPDAELVLGRGPFSFDGDRALLAEHRIDLVVAKNSGSEGARAKLDAARDLGLPVIMINRPVIAQRLAFSRPVEVLRWLSHGADRGV